MCDVCGGVGVVMCDVRVMQGGTPSLSLGLGPRVKGVKGEG